MKVLLVDAFNGEGYSEPDIKVSNLRNSIETLKIIEDMILSYGDGFVEKEMDGHYKDAVILSFDDGEDAGSIHIIDIPTNEFYVVQVQPQTNEVKFYVKMPTREKALEVFKEYLVYDDKYGFEEDDVENYDGEDFFGSHANNLDCEYYYFKIVQG